MTIKGLDKRDYFMRKYENLYDFYTTLNGQPIYKSTRARKMWARQHVIELANIAMKNIVHDCEPVYLALVFVVIIQLLVLLISYNDVAMKMILLYCSQMEWRRLLQLSHENISFNRLMHGPSLHSKVKLIDIAIWNNLMSDDEDAQVARGVGAHNGHGGRWSCHCTNSAKHIFKANNMERISI